MNRRRLALVTIALAAVAFRVIVWRLFEGPIIRGDARSYMSWAEAIAAGNLSGFSDYPLHQLYPVLIAPAFAAHLPIAPYLFVLQTALSLGTVALIYAAARHFTSFTGAVAAAAVAAAYPSFLFWYPYILSETSFFFFLALFLASLTRVLERRSASASGSLLLLGISAVLLLIARPVSVAVLAVGIPAAMYVVLAGRAGKRQARLVTCSAIAAAVVGLVLFFSVDTSLRRAVLRNPTVAQSFWLSTRLSSSSLSEWLPIAAESTAINERFPGNVNQAYELKVEQAAAFVREKPGTFFALAARRFFSYWMLSAFSDGWSPKHRLFDLVLISGLFLGAAVSVARHRGFTRIVLLAICLSLGLLTSFSQIDSDGRYRVPAELILILLAADGVFGAKPGRGDRKSALL